MKKQTMIHIINGSLVVLYLAILFLQNVVSVAPEVFLGLGALLVGILIWISWTQNDEDADRRFAEKWAIRRRRGTGVQVACEIGGILMQVVLTVVLLQAVTAWDSGGIDVSSPIVRRQLLERLIWIVFLSVVAGVAIWDRKEKKFLKLTGGQPDEVSPAQDE